ncbi:unnamed protein product [Thlaspi arvense]|uniref:Pectinesterase inhibitor domain-containing protein n=1 Tax=Thlaspi arvense TaxID=13288 RepID=A0AAU9RZR4_THLAR|nr:unnamed protein product [Thlaspi arvense]
MAFSCVTRNVCSILPLVVILSIAPLSTSFAPSDKVTKELVDQLCSNSTIHKNFCVPWLTFDPATFTLDLTGLVDLVLLKTQLFAYKNLAMMKGFGSTTTDPVLKAPYGTCVTGYELAIKTIEEAQALAISNSYQSASQSAFRSLISIGSCVGQLEGRSNVPAYVQQRNLLYVRMCTIDSVFSNVLAS